MLAFLATPIGRWIGGAVGAVLLILAIVGGFRWWLHEHDTALLSGYVLQSEKDASDAKVKKLERDILIGQQILAQADKEVERLDIDAQKRQAADEAAISKTSGGSVVTLDDLRNVDRVRNSQ
jgi:hypothetical protein